MKMQFGEKNQLACLQTMTLKLDLKHLTHFNKSFRAFGTSECCTALKRWLVNEEFSWALHKISICCAMQAPGAANMALRSEFPDLNKNVNTEQFQTTAGKEGTGGDGWTKQKSQNYWHLN
jgi:hypothetical protein